MEPCGQPGRESKLDDLDLLQMEQDLDLHRRHSGIMKIFVVPG
ncbi:MAG: hypothetical protein ACFFC7_02795 [Candidatus Hermodarchaeota archaeon]